MTITSTPTADGYEVTLDGGPPLNYVATPPATASSPGTLNQFSHDGNYLYICVAPDTWLRAEILTW